MHIEPRTPRSSWQSSVISVGAADVFNPIEWALHSCVFLIDWNQDGASPRLKESAQKMLAETVRFHMEDFGEAGSLLQSLKQKGKRGYQNLIFSKATTMSFFSKYLAVKCSISPCHLHAFMFSSIYSKCVQGLMYDRKLYTSVKHWDAAG